MPKVTAAQAAISLRKLADSLDSSPDAIIEKPYLTFHCFDKASFIAVAKLMPRPFRKSLDKGDEEWRRLRLEYSDSGIDTDASVAQSLTCELIEPAKPAVYRCDPILSLDEIDEVGK